MEATTLASASLLSIIPTIIFFIIFQRKLSAGYHRPPSEVTRPNNAGMLLNNEKTDNLAAAAFSTVAGIIVDAPTARGIYDSRQW